MRSPARVFPVLSRSTRTSPSRPGSRSPWRTPVLGAAGVLLVTGCGSPATVEGAENGADPACASVMLAMPETMADQQQRETTSQGTTAYGDPTGLIARCGVPEPPPTTDPCTNVNGVDWLISEVDGRSDQWRAVTYGRSPAVELLFDTNKVPSSTALVDSGSAVQTIDQDRECLSVEDTLEQQG